MLIKSIFMSKLPRVVSMASTYHSTSNLKPQYGNSKSSSNGYLTESQWTDKRAIDLPKSDGFTGKILEQPVNIKCKNLEFKTWDKYSQIEDLDHKIKDVLVSYGLDNMTPIQKHTYDILNRQLLDLLGSAETGSGKTIAFLAPILSRLLSNYPENVMNELKSNNYSQFPLFLILAPTRELVQQIAAEAKKILILTNLRACDVIGGIPAGGQIGDLNRGCHTLVATPGRLIDLVGRGVLSLKHCKNLVLDEADRMLDMGFEPQIRQIVNQLDMPKESNRHTSMFSATFPNEVLELARSLMNKNYGQILIGKNAGSSETCIPESIKQTFIMSTSMSRFKDCIDFVEKSNKKTIIFCNRKSDVDTLCRMFRQVKVVGLHGDFGQNQRENSFRLFKNNSVNVLVATAIAARGLDVSDVECVVNLGLPIEIDEYMHRAGRCGRMGRPGNVTTFVMEDDLGSGVMKELIKMLRRTNQEVPEILNNPGSGRFKPMMSYGSSNFSQNNKFGSNNFGQNMRYGSANQGNNSEKSGFDSRRSTYGDNRRNDNYQQGRQQYRSGSNRQSFDEDEDYFN